MNNFIIMDLENNNKDCNSICSIAILVIQDDKVVKEISSLINPESRFDDRNSHINKITEDMIIDKPNMKDYWDEIKEYFNDYVLIGHNAHYDLTVLAKTLYSYGIDIGEVKYKCTWELSEKYMTNIKSHKLHHICEDLNYQYNAHEALSDCYACLNLYNYLDEKYNLDNDEIKIFSYKRKKKDKIRGEEI